MNDRFWAKVLFKEFIRHYRKLDDAQIVADVRKSMDDLEDLVDDADSFGSKMVRWSMERVDQYPQARENGKKGGRPKKSPQDAPNGNAGVDMSDAGNGAASKSQTSCDQFTADGDTREDSRVRYAPPSCSPEDGNPAETAPSHGGSVASLNGPRQAEARQSRRTGGSSVRGMAKVAQPSVRSRASFRNKEDFIQWAIDDGLDPVDAGECWEATEERGGKDADGNTVKNMKAFARQWCRTRANNRRTA